VQLLGVSGYGNLHAAGVVATISGDANGNAAVALEWRRTGAPAYRAGHPLARIGAGAFVGSLFFLDPATSWDVRVTISDPNGVVGSPTATASFSTRAIVFAQPSLRTLYVAPNGNDGNTGTDPGHPLLTIQEAADRSQPGDLVSIAPGVYRESVNVPTSGTAPQPIVFRGSGAGAILDGADAAIDAGVAWSAAGSGVYSRVTGFATGHVVTERGRLFRYDNLTDLQALPAGPPGGFWFDGTTLRVKFDDGSSPATHAMHVARFEDGFYVDGRSNVRVENVEIRHYGAGDYGKGVYLRYSSDCAVLDSTIHEVEAAGVWIKGGDRHRIEGNHFYDTSIPGWVWDWTKGSSAEGNGVVMTDDLGRGHVVRDNLFEGTFNGIGPCGGSAPPGGALTMEVDVYDNVFRDHNDDALEPEGYCSNIRMWGNVVTDVHMAFAVAPASPGPTWILDNVAWDFGSTRTSQIDGWLASALKINSDYPDPIGPLFLYHNTFVTTAPDTSAMTLLNNGESTYIVARNNVFAGTDFTLYKVNPVVLDWDWDDLWTTSGSEFAYWMGAHYHDLAALRAVSGQETNGRAAAPALVDPANGDFTPAAGSPLVDHGVVIAGINDVVATPDPPDLGAVQRSELFRDGFETATTERWSGHAP
jgi:hypothetical protein